MTYVLVSRDPRSGMEARTSVHNRFLANYVGMRELDRAGNCWRSMRPTAKRPWK